MTNLPAHICLHRLCERVNERKRLRRSEEKRGGRKVDNNLDLRGLETGRTNGTLSHLTLANRELPKR